MPVLFKTGQLNTCTIVVGFTDGRIFRIEGKGRKATITLAGGKPLPCIAARA